MAAVLSLWKGRIERDPLKAEIERICEEVATETGVSTARLYNAASRERRVSQARTTALQRIIQETGAPISHIAQKLGVERKAVQRARALL